MKSDEILKKLVPGSINWEPRIGGAIEISWEDVSGALSYLPDHISNYARLKHQEMEPDDRSKYYKPTYLALKLETENLKVSNDWPVSMLNKIVKMVLCQEITPNICQTCNGTKNREIENKTVECFTCKGTGHIKRSQGRCADYLGISLSAYKRTWKNNENHVYSIIADWDYLISRAISLKIGK